MSGISAVRLSSQALPYQPAAAAPDGRKPEDGKGQEITTVTTHCNKKHKHDQSCPHTVSTIPAPQSKGQAKPASGETGNRLDETV